jgi:hypothetical protein
MLLFVQISFRRGVCSALFGRREIGADQVLIDLDELCFCGFQIVSMREVAHSRGAWPKDERDNITVRHDAGFGAPRRAR